METQKDKAENFVPQQEKEQKNSFIFTILCMCFVAVLIVSNIAASNTIDVTSFMSLSAAEILFPISYIINDLMVEIYGINKTKKVIFLGLAVCLCSLFFLYLTTLLPTGYSEYQVVFGISSGSIIGITVASVVAFIAGSLINSYIMHWLKLKHKEKK
ncbi:MAG: VUT family protein, partial [Clostridia bacterium]|nr:VUT family protein [Clostridia bacterium]MDD3862430.1 VUT family protein [Clostridia bacterium]